MSDTRCWAAIGECGHFTGVVTESADDDYAKRKVGDWAWRGDEIHTMTIDEFRTSDREMCNCDPDSDTGEGDG